MGCWTQACKRVAGYVTCAKPTALTATTATTLDKIVQTMMAMKTSGAARAEVTISDD